MHAGPNSNVFRYKVSKHYFFCLLWQFIIFLQRRSLCLGILGFTVFDVNYPPNSIDFTLKCGLATNNSRQIGSNYHKQYLEINFMHRGFLCLCRSGIDLEL